MGAVIQNGIFVGGLDEAVMAKIGADTLHTSADDLSGAINEHEEDIVALQAKTNRDCIVTPMNMGSASVTVSNTTWVDLKTVSNINIPAGNYLIFASVEAAWTSPSFQFQLGLKVDSTRFESSYNTAYPRTIGSCLLLTKAAIPTSGNHTLTLQGHCTGSKEVDRKSTRLNSSHILISRMPSSA